MRIAFVFNRKTKDSVDEAEFDTDETIEAISLSLGSNHHTIIPIEMTNNYLWIDKLQKSEPNFIFNTAEGFFGTHRESLAPIIFEHLNIPYSGSNPRTCFITMDKYLCKKLVSEIGCKTPNAFFINKLTEIREVANKATYPVFVKPNFEGSSKGVTTKSRCTNAYDFVEYASELLTKFKDGILVEDFIDGKDISVPYITNLGNEGVLEPYEYIGTKKKSLNIYDYQMKIYCDDNIDIQCPAILDTKKRNTVIKYMQSITSYLDILDFARADFRITPSGEIYFIEINALPSLQPDAGIFESSKMLNMNYTQTIQALLNSSLKRQNIYITPYL